MEKRLPEVLVVWLGHRPGRLALVPLYLRSNLLKYLPGGIWHFLDRFRALQPDLGGGKALVSVLMEPMVMAVAALLWVPFGGFQNGLALLCVLPSLPRCCCRVGVSLCCVGWRPASCASSIAWIRGVRRR